MICISISSLGEIGKLPAGAELIELRLDLIRKDPVEVFPLIPPGCKSLVTCRPGTIQDQTRLSWLKSAMHLGAAIVDAELESEEPYLEDLRRHSRENGVELIVSYHQFDATPDRDLLADKLQQCFDRGGDIAKIATQIHSREDLLRLLSLYHLPGRKVILGMGPMGRISRIAAPYLGAEFTFASPGAGLETAAGQLDYKQLKELYQVINQP